MANPEQLPHSPESSSEKIEAAAAERLNELKERQAEILSENSEHAEKKAERARIEADQEAISGHEANRSEHQKNDTQPPVIMTKSRKESFKQTMSRVQKDMPAPSRAFSKFIHNPAVERVSDIVGSSIARPSAMLGGGLMAFLLVLALYSIAKFYGFSLTGFETIAAFIIGWTMGLLIDFVRLAIFSKR